MSQTILHKWVLCVYARSIKGKCVGDNYMRPDLCVCSPQLCALTENTGGAGKTPLSECMWRPPSSGLRGSLGSGFTAGIWLIFRCSHQVAVQSGFPHRQLTLRLNRFFIFPESLKSNKMKISYNLRTQTVLYCTQ